METNVKLEIGDFLGFCDLYGVEALDTEKIQKLEEYIELCNEGANNGNYIVEDAIYDKLMEIIHKVNPDSPVANHIWEDYDGDDLEDTDALVRKNPMYSIMTVKDFECDEIKTYIDRLPDTDFDAHISVKLNGHGIRLKYQDGDFIQARSRARSSAGRDITRQLEIYLQNNDLDHIDSLESFNLCEIRGEWVLPFYNLDKAREYNKDIKSAFSAVASMGRDSASEEEWGLLRFVAYEFVADDYIFNTKEDEYNLLEELGFEVPVYWVINDLNKATLLNELPDIVNDCELDIKPDNNGENGYEYYTDGLVFAINDVETFRSIGDDGGHYKFGNMALKVGYWKQDMYSGYIQTILWMRGKTKLTPVAIVSEEEDSAEFENYDTDGNYVLDRKEILNYSSLGVTTASGNVVRRVPLYEPNNLVMLDAYRGEILHFRYGGEAGVVPCFEDGTPLVSAKVKNILSNDIDEDEWVEMY